MSKYDRFQFTGYAIEGKTIELITYDRHNKLLLWLSREHNHMCVARAPEDIFDLVTDDAVDQNERWAVLSKMQEALSKFPDQRYALLSSGNSCGDFITADSKSCSYYRLSNKGSLSHVNTEPRDASEVGVFEVEVPFDVYDCWQTSAGVLHMSDRDYDNFSNIWNVAAAHADLIEECYNKQRNYAPCSA